MIQEQPIAALDACAHFFRGPEAELTVASIRAGNTAAQLWTWPAGALLWDKGNNVLYVAGEPGGAVESLAALVSGTLRARARAEGRPYFSARPLSAPAGAQLPAIFCGVALHAVRKQLYAYRRPEPPAVPEPAVEGLRFVPIDGELLARADLPGVDEIAGEVRQMWRSPALFVERGLGMAALFGGRVACWCTSEYVSPAMCGIGIATDPAHQRRGIATATAARVVAAWLRRGVTPYWGCRAENLPSARVAQKLGFTLVEECEVWAGTL